MTQNLVTLGSIKRIVQRAKRQKTGDKMTPDPKRWIYPDFSALKWPFVETKNADFPGYSLRFSGAIYNFMRLKSV